MGNTKAVIIESVRLNVLSICILFNIKVIEMISSAIIFQLKMLRILFDVKAIVIFQFD